MSDSLIGPGLLSRGGLMLISGPVQINNLTQQLMFEIASGKRIMGLFKSKRAGVIYLAIKTMTIFGAQEKAHFDFKNMIDAYSNSIEDREITNSNIGYAQTDPVDLVTLKDIENIKDDIIRYTTGQYESGFLDPIEIVFISTLNDILPDSIRKSLNRSTIDGMIETDEYRAAPDSKKITEDLRKTIINLRNLAENMRIGIILSVYKKELPEVSNVEFMFDSVIEVTRKHIKYKLNLSRCAYSELKNISEFFNSIYFTSSNSLRRFIPFSPGKIYDILNVLDSSSDPIVLTKMQKKLKTSRPTLLKSLDFLEKYDLIKINKGGGRSNETTISIPD